MWTSAAEVLPWWLIPSISFFCKHTYTLDHDYEPLAGGSCLQIVEFRNTVSRSIGCLGICLAGAWSLMIS